MWHGVPIQVNVLMEKQEVINLAIIENLRDFYIYVLKNLKIKKTLKVEEMRNKNRLRISLIFCIAIWVLILC